jgi:hypothetical protein
MRIWWYTLGAIGQFIAFSKKVSGYELKAAQFEAALVKWKKTTEYKKLLEKYNLEN